MVAANQRIVTPWKDIDPGTRLVTTKQLRKEIARVQFPENFKLADHFAAVTRESNGKLKTVHEAIGMGDFPSAFSQRQRFEVDAGRQEEPLLYPAFYEITEDSTLPRIIQVDRLGPAGVVFQEVLPGGEVKFASMGSSELVIPIKHWAVGLEYEEDVVIYNELWRLPDIEREVGVSLNATLNHIHIGPILSATLTGNNATDGTSLTSFKATDDLVVKYLRTIEAAMTAASEDPDNPRRGPYMLLVGMGDGLVAERALLNVPQQGVSLQVPSVLNLVERILVYNGWTGSMGGKSFTYPGVTSGTGYLIDLGYRRRHFRSYVKHNLRNTMGNPDVSRFILEQSIWDIRLGSYTSATGGVQKITWPTADSGDS